MPRFVILRHDSPQGTHWDFMLEMGASLATWALAQPPAAAAQRPREKTGTGSEPICENHGKTASSEVPVPIFSQAQIPARALPEHRLAYLDYQGPISGGRGAVSRWCEGTYQVERQADGLLVLLLSGKTLSGRATLQRTGAQPDQWTFSLEK